MFKLVKDQLGKSLLRLKDQLENPRRSYDIDVATQNAILLKIIEKGLLDDSEPKRGKRTKNESRSSKSNNESDSGAGEG